MQEAEMRRAVRAAVTVASTRDVTVDDTIVLSDSNRVVVRLMPCDVVARVAPVSHFASIEREVDVVTRLAATDAPVVPLDPRFDGAVHVQDGFEISMWTYVEPVDRSVAAGEYAQALVRLHAGMRDVGTVPSHVMDRIANTRRDVIDRDATPDLPEADRALLESRLDEMGRSMIEREAPEQLLHGEPHPWNIMNTAGGALFVDFENTTVGPVEYDLAWVPDDVAARYRHADRRLLDACRGVVLAIIATHRWRRGDEHPSGRASGVAFINALRDGPPWPALDEVTW